VKRSVQLNKSNRGQRYVSTAKEAQLNEVYLYLVVQRSIRGWIIPYREGVSLAVGD